jgi:hypothetical protein
LAAGKLVSEPSVGNDPVRDGFDILSPLLYLGILGILLFEGVSVA